MPNFHTNQLVISSDESGMLNVLKAIEKHFIVSKDLEYDEPVIDDTTSVEEAYQLLYNCMDGCYYNIFDDDSTTRYISDTAIVSMQIINGQYTLAIEYATAWCSNYDAATWIFEDVGNGTYGFAFIDADEGDGYSSITISTFDITIHEGDGKVYNERFSTEQSDKFMKKIIESLASKASIRDCSQSELALFVAAAEWPEFTAFEEKAAAIWGQNKTPIEGFDLRYREPNATKVARLLREKASSFESIENWKSNSFYDVYHIDWIDPKEEDLRKINETVLDLLCQFPHEYTISDYWQNLDEGIDLLVPGDDILIESSWEDNAALHIIDKQKQKIVDLKYLVSENKYSKNAIACLLPHLCATVQSIDTPSTRTVVNKAPIEFSIFLEFVDKLDVPELLNEVHRHIDLDPAERHLTSQANWEVGH